MTKTLEIDFCEYLSCVTDGGEIKPGFEKQAEAFIREITEAVNDFIGKAVTIAHHGMNVGNGDFRVCFDLSTEENLVAMHIISAGHGVATFNFSMDNSLLLTSQYELVSIETK